MNENELNLLTHRVIGSVMKVHRVLGPGFLESVYQNALAHVFTRSEMSFQPRYKIPVYFEDVLVGDFMADFLIDPGLIVEIKAIQNLKVEHEVQTVNYLTATRIDVGLLINFGGASLEYKRKYRKFRKGEDGQD